MNSSSRAAPSQPAERPVLLVLDTGFPSISAMLRGIFQNQRKENTWTPLLADTGDPDGEALLLERQKWHGVISAHITPALVAACAAMRIPLVDLHDSPPRSGITKVRPDNVAIGHMGAEHFVERRFRKFGFCGFRGQSWSDERRHGFEESLRLAGFGCAVHEIEYPGDAPDWDEQQIELLAEWLVTLPRGTAVMTANDRRALQVLRSAAKVGLRVPEDLAVLGVNNDKSWCELATPSLSSVAPNFYEAGVSAAEQMSVLLSGGSPTTLDIQIEPAGVVARESSDVLSFKDTKVARAVDYIREHACRGITVEAVVAQVHASRSQMESRFRRFLGRSPQAEIRRVQVEKIRELLSTTELPLKDIADHAGFEHVEYMCVLFKRMTGQTMGQYRRNVGTHEKQRALA